MKGSFIFIVVCFFLVSGTRLWAQSLETKIDRIEMDGRRINKPYKASFLVEGNWVEAKTTATGFVVPKELATADHLTLIIRIGKHNLKFPEVHISKFSTTWTVGIDTKPFSRNYVNQKDARRLRRLYYIVFSGKGLETRLIMKIY
jgi:hypothetical protein